MIDNAVIIRTELQVAAQKMLFSFMENNERIKEQVEAGIKRAFESVDLEEMIATEVRNTIRRAVTDTTVYGEIRKRIQDSVNQVLDDKLDGLIREAFKDES